MSSSPAVADAPPSDDELVVVSFRAMLPFYRTAPKLEAHDGRDRWERWARTMGSNSSSAAAFRASKPAKLDPVRDFQDILSSYLFRLGSTRDAEKRSLAALFPAVKAAQLSYKEELADAADDVDSDDSD